MFSQGDYEFLHRQVFRPSYAGYKPQVVEIPNGDGRPDATKRYAHIACRYIRTADECLDLIPFLVEAHAQALQVAEAVHLNPAFWPRMEYGALRVLDYPPGAGSVEHEDFDLFTLMCYRDQPDLFISREEDSPTLQAMRSINRQAHVGQLGQLAGLGPATPHRVQAATASQHAIVYFALPDHTLRLPSGMTVRHWLNERMARSRTSFKEYE